MGKLTEHHIKGLSYKDVVILVFIEQYPSKTTRELKRIIGCDYSSLTQSIKKLLLKGRIIKNNTYPISFEIK